MAAYDSEEARWVDRILAIGFRMCRDAGFTTVNRAWIAKKLNRSEKFVTRNWLKNPYNCKLDSIQNTHAESLSQESKNIINESLNKRKKVFAFW